LLKPIKSVIDRPVADFLADFDAYDLESVRFIVVGGGPAASPERVSKMTGVDARRGSAASGATSVNNAALTNRADAGLRSAGSGPSALPTTCGILPVVRGSIVPRGMPAVRAQTLVIRPRSVYRSVESGTDSRPVAGW
jgi:hypothetical protein